MIKNKYLTVCLLILISVSLLFSSCKNNTAEDETTTDTAVESGTVPEDLKTADTSAMDFDFSDKDLSGDYYSSQTKILLSSSGASVSGSGANLSGNTVSITAAGTYILSGSSSDISITVAAGDSDKVQLVLNNAEIKNSAGPAILIKSADKVFITLADGTENNVSDGASYTVSEGDSVVDAAIFSLADLTVNGTGTLNVSGNYKHGIVSKDDLTVTSCKLNITAKNVGLNGKDCVKLGGSTVNITAGSDGIRSDNTEDTARGYVYIKDGTVTVTAGNDGIQAQTVFKSENPTVTITSGGGSGGSLNSSAESYKGIKACSDILISGGAYSIKSLDDCVHSNNTVNITGGTFSLSSGDDGIHADTDLSISGGEIDVSKSYEGIEGSRIIISGGKINITASDDGINAAGG
ncbi:MAG: carbohydrate-binding domain-containing protein, partial [Candidatus Fimenecus sp.]